MLTGDPFFPGGMGEFPAPQNQFLVFEDGPSVDVTLQWATYRDASDQCSLSRIWGGIHPPADDMPGRLIGAVVGVEAFHYAESYFYRDEDLDGFYSDEDCDDHNPAVYPGAPELCDGLDNDCDGMIDDSIPVYTYYRDNDNDAYGDAAISMDTCLTPAPAGFVDNSLDCDDANPDIHPGAPELCDGIDNDCNGMVDDGITLYTYYRDSDNDTYGDAAISMDTCLTPAPAGFVDNSLDCDDANSDIHPGASELCDGADNDCNGMVDDGLAVFTYYRDSDNDTYGDAMAKMDTCLISPPAGFVTDNTDCDDNNAAINPGAVEVFDSLDNDCNGLVDDGVVSVDLLAGKAWKLYPNPANEIVHLEMNVAEPLIARLVNPEGQLMRETTLHFISGTASISLEALPPGIYFMVLSGQNGKPQMLGKIVRL